MTSSEISKAIAEADSSSYTFNVNLPSWRSAGEASPEEKLKAKEAKQKKQNLIALGVLVVLVVAIIYIKRK